jgi:phosphoenolpyruvate carboxykinase (GTP)
MTAEATASPSYDLSDAPTQHPRILAWVKQVAELCQPDSIHWADGSRAEWDDLAERLIVSGTWERLDPERKPNSFWARTDPSDVARVEERTFICSVNPDDAGPTNHWRDPDEMKAEMTEHYRGSMRGRTMFVIPFVMGPLENEKPMFGIEISDSPYVVCSMKIMTRMGRHVLDAMGTDADYVPCLHSVGAPLEPGQADVPWPCNDTKYITHFPEERMIWSYGSGYGGNSLLGKKCYSLRIASVMARDEGWMAEHMLILKLVSPVGKTHYIAAAFPSACGKTNLAMLRPTIPGWTVETLGDDIAWMRFGPDGRLYAQNPEYGLFGVAPGTSYNTNYYAMKTIDAGNSIFTNVAKTDDGDIWWEGMTDEVPGHLTDWHGQSWTAGAGHPSSHPNSRFCTPITQCPILAPEFDSPQGVPIDAILFGGRRATTIPLVTEARDWNHGVFMGATLSSETTAAAKGAVGVVRRDPMAMLPFIGYHAGDYIRHWVSIGKSADAAKLPRIYYVNWFRKSPEGRFLWPGFAENSRVIKWIIERIEGTAAAVDTPIGRIPAPGALDVDDLDITQEELDAAMAVVPEEWKGEVTGIVEWFEKFGEKLPSTLWAELDALKARLG